MLYPYVCGVPVIAIANHLNIIVYTNGTMQVRENEKCSIILTKEVFPGLITYINDKIFFFFMEKHKL